MAEEQSLNGVLSDMIQYFMFCKANAAKGSAAERKFTVYVEAVSDAKRLLKEQEPVEPKTHEVVVGIFGATRSEYLCGDCGCGLIKNDKWRTKFCPECGRGVKWE